MNSEAKLRTIFSNEGGLVVQNKWAQSMQSGWYNVAAQFNIDTTEVTAYTKKDHTNPSGVDHAKSLLCMLATSNKTSGELQDALLASYLISLASEIGKYKVPESSKSEGGFTLEHVSERTLLQWSGTLRSDWTKLAAHFGIKNEDVKDYTKGHGADEVALNHAYSLFKMIIALNCKNLDLAAALDKCEHQGLGSDVRDIKVGQ